MFCVAACRGTVTGGMLASNISISTTRNIATTGTGTITSAGLDSFLSSFLFRLQAIIWLVSGALNAQSTLAVANTATLNGDVALGSDTNDKVTVKGVIQNIQANDALVFEGSSADSNRLTLAVTNPTAARTITLPDATGQVVLQDGIGTVTIGGAFNQSHHCCLPNVDRV